jgi:hypothetical protein
MSNLGVVFHIWCKRLDLFWSVRGLTSKMPTYPTCQLAPSPLIKFVLKHVTSIDQLYAYSEQANNVISIRLCGLLAVLFLLRFVTELQKRQRTMIK